MKPLPFVLALALLSFEGCTYNRGMIITPATLGPNEKVVGIVSGKSGKDYLFGGLIQWGDDSLQSAMFDAIGKSSAPAQGLSNVFAENNQCHY